MRGASLGRKPVPNFCGDGGYFLPLTVENHVFDSSHAVEPSVAGAGVYSLLKGLSKYRAVYPRTAGLSIFSLTVQVRYAHVTYAGLPQKAPAAQTRPCGYTLSAVGDLFGWTRRPKLL